MITKSSSSSLPLTDVQSAFGKGCFEGKQTSRQANDKLLLWYGREHKWRQYLPRWSERTRL